MVVRNESQGLRTESPLLVKTCLQWKTKENSKKVPKKVWFPPKPEKTVRSMAS